EEAFAVSDKVGVFKEGHLEQWDTPYNLYHRPQTAFVASFIGQGYFIRGELLNREAVQTELGVIHCQPRDWPSGSPVDVLLRPDDVAFAEQDGQPALVLSSSFLGANTLYRLRLATGGHIEALFPGHVQRQAGEHVGVRLAASQVVTFAAPGSAL
ncbi:MAG: TOBE domain-containing protein, partial [Pseudomonas sp.]